MEIIIGRIVLYTLTEDDATQINRRRTTGPSIAERIKNNNLPTPEPRLGGEDQNLIPQKWPIGAQAHIGNEVAAGDIFPMMVTRVWSPGYVNGQVLLDGNDCLWATSVTEGTEPHTWAWPPRA